MAWKPLLIRVSPSGTRLFGPRDSDAPSLAGNSMAAEICTQGLDTGFVELGYAKVALLGVVQGITELLPISSTAHMRIVPALLGWRDPGSAFSAAMQLAALAAVISYFWSDVRTVTV